MLPGSPPTAPTSLPPSPTHRLRQRALFLPTRRSVSPAFSRLSHFPPSQFSLPARSAVSVPERRTGAGGLRGALTRQQTAASQPALHTYLATYAATRLHHNRSTAPAPAAASGPGAGPGMRRRVGGRHDWPTRKAQRPGDWATRWDRERERAPRWPWLLLEPWLAGRRGPRKGCLWQCFGSSLYGLRCCWPVPKAFCPEAPCHHPHPHPQA